MADPKANLGPIVALDAPAGGGTGTPIFVGGRAPRYPGNANIQRKRLFGLRALVR